MTLYDVSSDLAALLARLDDGELTADLEAELDRLQGSLEAKLEGIARASRNLKAEAEALETEAKRLAARAVSLKNAERRLAEWAVLCLDAAKLRSVKAGIFTVRVQNSPPAVKVYHGAEIPDRFVTVIPEQREVDKKLLLLAWRAGEALPPGVTVEVGRHLRVS